MFFKNYKDKINELEEKVDNLQETVTELEKTLNSRFIKDAEISFNEKERRIFKKAKKEIMDSLPEISTQQFFDVPISCSCSCVASYFGFVFKYKKLHLIGSRKKRAMYDGFEFSKEYTERLYNYNIEVLESKGQKVSWMLK